MSIQSWEPAAPTMTLDRPPAQERRSVVKPSRIKQYEPLVLGTLSVVIALTAWQLVANARIYSILFLPGPWDVAQAFVKLFQTDDIWLDIGTSGAEMGIGYGMAIVFGLVIGLLMGWYTRFQFALDPFVNFFYSTPRIVLIPLFILWWGIEMQPKIAVIFRSLNIQQLLAAWAACLYAPKVQQLSCQVLKPRSFNILADD